MVKVLLYIREILTLKYFSFIHTTFIEYLLCTIQSVRCCRYKNMIHNLPLGSLVPKKKYEQHSVLTHTHKSLVVKDSVELRLIGELELVGCHFETGIYKVYRAIVKQSRGDRRASVLFLRDKVLKQIFKKFLFSCLKLFC